MQTAHGSTPLLWHRQAEAGLSSTSVATCVSTYFRETWGVSVDSSHGPQNNGTSKWADPWEALTPDSLLTLLNLPCQPS